MIHSRGISVTVLLAATFVFVVRPCCCWADQTGPIERVETQHHGCCENDAPASEPSRPHDDGCDCRFNAAPLDHGEPVAVVFHGVAYPTPAWISPESYVRFSGPVTTTSPLGGHDPPGASTTSLYSLGCLLLT